MTRDEKYFYRCERDGFEGQEIGQYITREGIHGLVLQQIKTRVVHVYRVSSLIKIQLLV